jgi:hypothetical protein
MLGDICRYLDPRQSAPDPEVNRRSHPTRVIQGPRLYSAIAGQRFRNIVYPCSAFWTEIAGHGPAAFGYSTVCLEFSARDSQLVGSDDNGQPKRTACLTATLRAMASISHMRFACDLVTNSATKTASRVHHRSTPCVERLSLRSAQRVRNRPRIARDLRIIFPRVTIKLRHYRTASASSETLANPALLTIPSKSMTRPYGKPRSPRT